MKNSMMIVSVLVAGCGVVTPPDAGVVVSSDMTMVDLMVVKPADGGGCKASNECNDNDSCTDDYCSIEGQCVYRAKARCVQPDMADPSKSQCVKNADCDDKIACTNDICAAGQCFNLTKLTPECAPDMAMAQKLDAAMPVDAALPVDSAVAPKPDSAVAGCTSSKECEDGDLCTQNVCTTEHVCLPPVEVANCRDMASPPDLASQCLKDSDCDDKNSCTVDICVATKCIHGVIANCSTDMAASADMAAPSDLALPQDLTPQCLKNSDCDDKNACTIDLCDNAGQCLHGVIQGCSTDMAAPVDMASPPDLALPPDMTVVPDLAKNPDMAQKNQPPCANPKTVLGPLTFDKDTSGFVKEQSGGALASLGRDNSFSHDGKGDGSDGNGSLVLTCVASANKNFAECMAKHVDNGLYVAGTKYRVTYWAIADGDNPVQTQVIQDQANWNPGGLSEYVVLDLNWNLIQFSFTALAIPNPPYRTSVNNGWATGNVWVDQFMVESCD